MSNAHEEEALGKAYDARLMRRLLQYMRPYKWRVVLAMALVAIVTPLELAPPGIFQLAIEELHDSHAGNVFLQEGVDPGDGGADVAVGVAHVMAEDEGHDENAGKNGKRVEREAGVHPKKEPSHDGEQEKIVDHRDDAGGKEIVQGVHIGGYARDEAADRIAVVIAHWQALQVTEDFGAHVVHGLLADTLHDADLDVLRDEIENQDEQVDNAQDRDALPGARFGQDAFERGRKITINRELENPWRRQFQRRDDSDERHGEHNAPLVWPHVLKQTAHQA